MSAFVVAAVLVVFAATVAVVLVPLLVEGKCRMFMRSFARTFAQGSHLDLLFTCTPVRR